MGISTGGEMGRRTGRLAADLVEAAGALIEAQGIEALSLRALASSLGVTHAAVYRHYRDRNALLAAVLAEGFNTVSALNLPIAKTDPRRRLEAYAAAYAEFALDHPNLFLAMTGPRINMDERYADLEAAIEASLAPVVEAIAAMPAGAARKPLENRSRAVVLFAALQGILAQAIYRRIGLKPSRQEAFIRDTVRRLVAGLALQD